MSQQPTDALLKRFKEGNKERFPDIGNVMSEIGGEWVFKTIILSMEDYVDEQTASLREQHREESVRLIRNLREQYQNEIASVREECEQLKKENERLKENSNE
jgi:cell shape-determining protein MreC